MRGRISLSRLDSGGGDGHAGRLRRRGRQWCGWRRAGRDDLAGSGVLQPEDLLTHRLMGGENRRVLTAGAELNTDDNMRIEYSTPRFVLIDTVGNRVKSRGSGISKQDDRQNVSLSFTRSKISGDPRKSQLAF